MQETCRECEQTIEEYGSRKDKICKQCYIRRINCKNRGIEYIPVKDLDEKEKLKVLKRRGVVPKNTEVTVKKTRVKAVDSEAQRILNNKKLVEEDIEKALKSSNIDFKVEDFNIVPLITMLDSFLETYSDNSEKMSSLKQIYNRLSTDYCHSKERWSLEYLNHYEDYSPEELVEVKRKKEDWDDRHSHLLHCRRKAMYTITQFEVAKDLVDKLMLNKDLIKDTLIKINYIDNAYKNKKYVAESSQLVANESFSMNMKEDNDTIFIYKVELKTYGYNSRGQRTVGQFIRTVEGTSEKEALKAIAKFHKDRGFDWTYVESEADITNLGPKVPLICPRQ